jgi:uroporphyrinogen decarboxylase
VFICATLNIETQRVSFIGGEGAVTPRERQLATIKHQVTDRISIDAICIENQDKIAEYLEIEPNEVLDRLGIDGRIVAPSYTGELPKTTGEISITEWGTPNTGDYGEWRDNPLAKVESVAEVERYHWPDPENYNYESAAQQARTLGEKYAVRGPYWLPIFCRVCDLFGMEKALMKMVLEPMIFDAAIDHVYTRVMEICRLLLDACGDYMPIFCLGDDFATQKGMMFSRDYWRKYLKRRYAKLFEMAKDRGKFVWFHSCGDITDVIPDLIDIGMDVWETVQLHTLPITAEKLKTEYGKYITFFGGINTQRLPFVSPAEVQNEVIQCISVLGKGGGYICGPDHHIKPDVSVENTLALFDTALNFDCQVLFKNGEMNYS